MPGGDRTGPMGLGPLTGGGFGRGRGRRNRLRATERPGWQRAGGWEDAFWPHNAAAERSELQRQTAALEAELQRLRARIEEIETPTSK
jgi:hypothetical protein